MFSQNKSNRNETSAKFAILLQWEYHFLSELKKIMGGVDAEDAGPRELERLVEDAARFPKLLRALRPREVEEERGLQRGLVLNACHFAAEVLDVEGGGAGEQAAKLIARQGGVTPVSCIKPGAAQPRI